MKHLAFIFLLLLIVPASGQWCGLQDIFFQHQDSSDIPGYEEWINYPSGNTEVDENVSLTTPNTWYIVDSYATPAGTPDVTAIQSGLRTYYMYAYVENSAGTTTLNITVFKRSSAGIETRLYSIESPDIEATTVTLYTIPYVAPMNLNLDITDRLVAKIYYKTTSAATIKAHFVYQGTTHASFARSGFFICPDEKVSSSYAKEVPINPVIPIIGLCGATIILTRRRE